MFNTEHIRYPYMDIACVLPIVHIALVIVDSVGYVSEPQKSTTDLALIWDVDVFLDTIPFSGIELLRLEPGPPIMVGLHYPPLVFRGIK